MLDSHQHFWIYDKVKDAWITNDMQVIQRSFLPSHLKSELQQNKVTGCIAVQADQSEAETHFLLEQAAQNNFIKGVVGWVNLQDENIDSRLQYFSQFPLLKGFRHIAQGEPQGFLISEKFCNGIALLKKYHFTYDILVYQHQLPDAIALVQKFPNQPFVLDHCGKPNIKTGNIAQWEQDIATLASYNNVYCKISGLVTEADWSNWTEEEITHCIAVAIKAFGTKRIMFGSDWPVMLLASSYKKWTTIFHQYIQSFTLAQQADMAYNNAATFYKINH